jgi:hypothetical protein
VVHKTGDVYSLDDDALEALSRQQFAAGRQREAYDPAPGLDVKTRKVLVAYLNADGSLKQIPAQPAKMDIILTYLAAAFEPGVDYTEKEVNTIIRRFNMDVSGLRRDLIDKGLMGRESNGSRYWRLDHGN